jgi:hypothetical protein
MRTLAHFPDLAAQIDTAKNMIDPAQIGARSTLRVWWRCSRGPDHVWQVSVLCRTKRGTGCPFCAGKRVSVTNSLVARFPEVAVEWHPTKNGSLKPSDVTCASNKKAWWQCAVAPDHQWETVIANRTSGLGCPFCAGKRVSSTNSLAICQPEFAAQWHPTKNGALRPEHVSRRSGRKVWWKCPRGKDHEWEATISSRRAVKTNGCPFCRGLRPSVTNSLARIAPRVAAEWHPTRNGTLTPADVTAGGERVVWWQCRKNPEHEWQCAIRHRTSMGLKCPFCSRRRVLPSTSLAAVYPQIAKQWNAKKNAPRTPYDVAPRAMLVVWWKCPRGKDHEWQSRVCARTYPASSGCPFCNHRRVCEDNCLATRYPSVAAEWHPSLNGELTPRTVAQASRKQAWWRCQFGHVWKARISSRTTAGAGCPVCARHRRRRVATTVRPLSAVRLAKYEGPQTTRRR